MGKFKFKFDFSGWATRNDLKCSDGRTIRRNAFADDDGAKVPLVWQHMHDDPSQVLGHALLENRDEGVYAYCNFNNSPKGQMAKELVRNGDVTSLSIYANNLTQNANRDVLHGRIRELSLVLSGANPGAYIDNVSLAHSDGTTMSDDEAVIYIGDDYLLHSEGGMLMGEDGQNYDEEYEDDSEYDEDDDEYDEDEDDEDDDSEYDEDDEEEYEDDSEYDDEDEEYDDDEDEDDSEYEDDEEEYEDEDEEDIEHSGIDDTNVMDVYDEMSEEDRSEIEDIIDDAIDNDMSVEDVLEDENFADFINSLPTAAERTAASAVIIDAINDNIDMEDEEDMKHNAFYDDEYLDGEYDEGETLSHSDMAAFEADTIADAPTYGKFSESVLAHAGEYGIENIDWLFPDAKELNTPPDFLKRETKWVAKVMGGTKHTPFSRIKTTTADITADEARARGYIKGQQKVEEIFTLLKRQTSPQTIYKKQKLDRDDIIDIKDFDVVLWIKSEMRMMLDEEIARAILIGDGRAASSRDKIKPDCIRAIALDTEGPEVSPQGKGEGLYAMNLDTVYPANSTRDQRCDLMLETVLLNRKLYRGSGNLTMFTTEDILTSFLLMKDGIGHRLYKDEEDVARAFRVKEIVTVPVMENYTIKDSENVVHTLDAIIVDLQDYSIGIDKGGAVNTFSDFDIDYNQEKYLIETRLSGALTKPKSAFVVRHTVAGAAEPVVSG